MTFLAPAGAIALLALPAIAALYLLKIRRARLPVSSLLFWRPRIEDRRANAPWQRIRASLLLFLQLAAAAAVAAALMRPSLAGEAGFAGITVVMLDASASMTATDVRPSRFEAAVARARHMASQLGPGQQMAIIEVGTHTRLLSPPSADVLRLDAALERARAGVGGANFAEGASLADALLAGRQGAVVLIGDGHLDAADQPPRLTAPFSYISVGSSGENAGIEAITQTPEGVFLHIANYGRRARRLQVRMLADGHLADVVPVSVGAGSTAQVLWTRLPPHTHVLEARLAPPDSFTLDDAAWLLTGPLTTRRVLMVTAGNGFLDRALSLHPGLSVKVVKPTDYRPEPFDLYVFDRWLPKGPLPTPALVVDPPAGQGPVPAGPQIDPGGVLPAAPGDPLTRDVSLADVHVQAAARVTVRPGWRTVISGVNDPLLLVHEGSPQVAELTFDIHRSDLPLRPAFPILVQNLVTDLLPGGFEGEVFSPGALIPLSADQGARWLEVTDPSGHTVRLAPPFTVPFGATQEPGVYTVREQLAKSIATSRFVVQFQDPLQARIEPGAAPPIAESGSRAGSPARSGLEIWPWVAGALLGLVAVEWLVFLRRA